ncbi:MAG: alanine--tRNA ligase [Bdellovibrionota bacterium]|nr:MAG: alanine--tRNA ligase [Bdellovibrionota bacterium]
MRRITFGPWEIRGPAGHAPSFTCDLGSDLKAQSEAGFRKEDGSYLEIWNLVFMQYDRNSKGELTPLPKPCVDTGAGLERVVSVVNGFPGNYDTDSLRPIISRCESLSGCSYDGRSYAVRDLRSDVPYARDVAMRVIADHSRAIAFLIADGVHPSSDGRGYVLRRVLRRAVPSWSRVGAAGAVLAACHRRRCRYPWRCLPGASREREHISRVVTAEEEKFSETWNKASPCCSGKQNEFRPEEKFSGEVAFLLHDTYGFPLDLTEDALKQFGLVVDTAAFEKAMSAQRLRSREDRAARGISFTTQRAGGKTTEFIGYSELECDSTITASFTEDDSLSSPLKEGDHLALFTERTPFYAESGGQVSDSGEIHINGATLRVIDVQKVQSDYFQHSCVVAQGQLPRTLAGMSAHLAVDAARRASIRSNHSATHLVHMALRSVLGSHVHQAGSRVDDSMLRFDFTHFEPLSPAQKDEIEERVNQAIRDNFEVLTQVLPIEEARKTGAIALFGEKYGERVRVVQIGPQSVEFCGGTHVQRAGDIGFVLISEESGISAGVRRIECVSAKGALLATRTLRSELYAAASRLKSSPHTVVDRIEKLQASIGDLQRELDSARAKVASSAANELLTQASTTAKGRKVIAAQVERMGVDTLRTLVDNLRTRIGSGIVALVSVDDGSATLVAGATSDLNKQLHVGNIVKEAAAVSGGKGGGRPDFAQAGGLDPSRIPAALSKIRELVE